MARSDETPRDLLFGLLALQIGLIDQDQLVSAFGAWSRAKGKALAEILLDRGAIDAESRSLLGAMAEKQLKLHGGDTEKSLTSIAIGNSTREKIAAVGDSKLLDSLATVGALPPDDSYATASHFVGTTTSGGQRFRVLRPHAKGGLGAVFVALDGELNREVALKEILDHHADDPNSRSRFLVEAEITGGLEHPGIVPVYGLGTHDDGRPYYAMRFIRGDNLKEAIESFHRDDSLRADPGKRSLDLRKLLRRFVDVCNAIDYAHSRGVLHRDIKPGNIIVGRHGETLVVDWGLAKPMGKGEVSTEHGERALVPSSTSGSAQTVHGQAVGTPAFMSPEQAAGHLDHLGPRSDVYSLGATLYSLLTGKSPFDGLPDIGEVLRAVEKGNFPPPRKLDPTIDAALEAVCLKAMANRPEDRYASARAQAEDVERWTADEPVSAWREPFARRARRWANRRRTLVTAAAVALVAGLAGTTWGLLEAKKQEKLANQKAEGERLAKIDALDKKTLAEKNEKKALAAAEEERKAKETVEDVLGFVENKVFVAARPKGQEGGLGFDVKLSDAITAALPAIEKGFPGKPLTEARLRMTIGRTFYYLGKPELAAPQFMAARSLYGRHLDPDHLDTLRSMHNLANSYEALGRLAEALKLREETFTLMKAKLGPDHPDTLRSMNNLANSYDPLGRNADGLKLREETLALQRAKLGPDHPDTLLSMNNLAESYAALGHLAEALKLREETLMLRRAKLGPDHPDTLRSMSNLAESYAALGRLAEALKVREETLSMRRAKLGSDHPDTLISMNNLALSYLADGRRAEASALLESASARDTEAFLKLAAVRAWFDDDRGYADARKRFLASADANPDRSALTRATLACGLRPSADPAELAALLMLGRKAVELNKGPWDLLALGLAEYRNGQFDGETLLAAAKAGDDHLAAGAASFYLAMALFRQGKAEEAKALATKTAAEMNPPLPADEQKPVLVNGSDDLILWLACKEAKALIGFDLPPAAPAKPDAK